MIQSILYGLCVYPYLGMFCFPGRPVVKTSPPGAERAGPTPDGEAKIPRLKAKTPKHKAEAVLSEWSTEGLLLSWV